jgi:hypothetical protein
MILEPVNRFDIEMVGWLVENEEVALGSESNCQGEPLALASGQSAAGSVSVGQAESVGQGDRLSILANHLRNCGVGAKRRVLVERGNPQITRTNNGARIWLFLPGNEG